MSQKEFDEVVGMCVDVVMDCRKSEKTRDEIESIIRAIASKIYTKDE